MEAVLRVAPPPPEVGDLSKDEDLKPGVKEGVCPGTRSFLVAELKIECKLLTFFSLYLYSGNVSLADLVIGLFLLSRLNPLSLSPTLFPKSHLLAVPLARTLT